MTKGPVWGLNNLLFLFSPLGVSSYKNFEGSYPMDPTLCDGHETVTILLILHVICSLLSNRADIELSDVDPEYNLWSRNKVYILIVLIKVQDSMEMILLVTQSLVS